MYFFTNWQHKTKQSVPLLPKDNTKNELLIIFEILEVYGGMQETEVTKHKHTNFE